MKKALLLALALLSLAPTAFANPFGWVTVFVPLNPGVVAGAGGTQWTTTLWVSNTSDQSFPIVCVPSILLTPPVPCPTLTARSTTSLPAPYATLTHQGFFLNVASLFGNFVPANALDFTLRTNDSASAPHSAGTEIPVVLPDAFRNALALPNVPLNGHSRLRLRVYGMDDGDVTIRAVGLTTNMEVWRTTLSMKGASPDPGLYPSFAEIDILSNFNTADDALRLELTSAVKVWGFVSITDNESQQFTIVSPGTGVYIAKSLL
jgi:hypothetical protein